MPTARFPLLCALAVGFLAGLTDSARPCPRESAGLASEEGDHSAASVSLLVVNKHKKPVTLFWVNHKGAEVKQTEVSADAEVTQSTFPGHAWRVRGAGQQKLLAEGVARGAVTRLVVERCGSSHSKSVYGFPVSKAWRESKAEKAANAAYLASDRGLLSHPQWSGCALDRALADASSVSQPGFHVLCTLPIGAEVEEEGAREGEGEGEDGEADEEAEVAPMRKKWAARVAVVRDGKVPEHSSRGAGAGAGAQRPALRGHLLRPAHRAAGGRVGRAERLPDVQARPRARHALAPDASHGALYGAGTALPGQGRRRGLRR
jgi:hypothetical protein